MKREWRREYVCLSCSVTKEAPPAVVVEGAPEWSDVIVCEECDGSMVPISEAEFELQNKMQTLYESMNEEDDSKGEKR